VDAMRLADALDHVVLFTGDGDFRALVAALQLKGKRVSVISTLQTTPAMVADELRRQADQFIDLAELEDHICRDPAVRAARIDAGPVDRPVAERRPDMPVRTVPARRPAAAPAASAPASASTLGFPDDGDK
jgi:NYN domain